MPSTTRRDASILLSKSCVIFPVIDQAEIVMPCRTLPKRSRSAGTMTKTSIGNRSACTSQTLMTRDFDRCSNFLTKRDNQADALRPHWYEREEQNISQVRRGKKKRATPIWMMSLMAVDPAKVARELRTAECLLAGIYRPD